MRTLIRNLTYMAILTLALSVVSALPARASAVAFTSVVDFPIDIVQFVPCANGGAGEDVALSGTIHEVYHVTFNSNGGATIKIHDNPQGVSGVGLTTGAKYQATGVTQDIFNVSGNNGQYSETYINNFRVVGQGPGNNFLVHETFHITFNANGELTAFVDNISTTCR
jgi:hypothetical protein